MWDKHYKPSILRQMPDTMYKNKHTHVHIHTPLLSQITAQAIGGKLTSLSRITPKMMLMLSGIQATKHILKTFFI